MDVESESLLVSVWNEGPGFPESEKKFLFRKFSRLHSEELQGRKGTGIGLYICWRIVQLHHGHIWADSLSGEWAEFLFRLPLLQAAEASPGMTESSF
jgi:signal transduction histidine kinase